MKKSTKKLTLTLVAVLVFVLCIGVLVACDLVPSNPSHTHSYSENWKSDKDNHWKECACGAKSEEAAHVNEQGDDELCDVCGYDLHVHSYGTAWKSDKDNHWKECSCGDKSELAAHVDANNDEKCDVCEYDMHVHNNIWASDKDGHWEYCTSCKVSSDTVIPHVDEKDADGNAGQDEICDVCAYNMHVHDYGTAWKSDKDNHWKECACGDKCDEAAHVDEKDADGNAGHDGKCDICGYIAVISVTVKDSDGNGIENATVGIAGLTATTNENGVATVNMFITSASSILISDYPESYVNEGGYYTAVGQYEYEITLISKATNTFKVGIEGITVKIMDGESVLASGVTDEDGFVSLSYPIGTEGKYTIALEGLSPAQYMSSGDDINKITNGEIITIVIDTYHTHTITVVCDEDVEYNLEGIKVNFYEKNSRGQLKWQGTATTDASGVAIGYAPCLTASIEVSIELDDGFTSETTTYSIVKTQTTYSATLTIKSTSTSGGDGDGEGDGSTSSTTLAIGDNTVSASSDGVAYTLTATNAGQYTISSTDENFGLMDPEDEFDGVWGAGSHTFTLSAGQTVSVLFCTNDMSLSDTYIVTVSYQAGTPTVSIPDAFIGDWVDENNVVFTVTSSSIVDDCLNTYTVGNGVEVISETEIKVDGLTWTYQRLDNRILVTCEDMEPYYLIVKLPTLIEGDNTVNASYDGEEYEFTATETGKYIISTDSEIAYIIFATGEELEGAGSVTFEVEEGQTISIYFLLVEEGEDTQYDVNISKEYPSIELGTKTITTDANGVMYTLTATEDGTYTISCESTNSFIMEKNYLFDAIIEGGSTSVVLTAGDKITICFYTWDDSSDSYEVTITFTAGTSEGSGTEGGDEGDEGDEGGSTFAFPTDLIGTWYLSDGTEIVISANSLTMDGAECMGYAIDDSGDVTYYNFSGLMYGSYGIYFDESSWYFGTYYGGILREAVPLLATDPNGSSEGDEGGEASGSIPEVFHGTWSGEFDSGDDEPWLMTITITADSISVDETSLTGEDIEINGMQITIVDIATLTYNAEDDTLLVDMEGVTATFTKDSTGTTASLDLGDNEVSATAEGVAMTFTSEAGGSYVLSTADENAYIGSNAWLEFAADPYTPYHFTLAAGESKTFYFSTNDMKDDTYIITIAQAEA